VSISQSWRAVREVFYHLRRSNSAIFSDCDRLRRVSFPTRKSWVRSATLTWTGLLNAVLVSSSGNPELLTNTGSLQKQFPEWPHGSKGKASSSNKKHMRVLRLAVLLCATSPRIRLRVDPVMSACTERVPQPHPFGRAVGDSYLGITSGLLVTRPESGLANPIVRANAC
jgi:hypothetical protein